MSSLTSDQVRSLLVTKTQRNAAISPTELVYALTGDFVDEAYAEHAPDDFEDFSKLPVREYELVVLLTWERVCISRASLCAPQSSVKQASVNFNADRDTPYEKNMRLAKSLRERYEMRKAAIAAATPDDEDSSGEGDIVMGELYRADDATGVSIPITTAASVTGTLSLYSKTQNSVAGVFDASAVFVFETSAPKFIGSIDVFTSDTPDIQEEWNSDTGYVSSSASKDQTITDSSRRRFKIGELSEGKVFVCLRITDTRGRVTFSNEIEVNIETATP